MESLGRNRPTPDRNAIDCSSRRGVSASRTEVYRGFVPRTKPPLRKQGVRNHFSGTCPNRSASRMPPRVCVAAGRWVHSGRHVRGPGMSAFTWSLAVFGSVLGLWSRLPEARTAERMRGECVITSMDRLGDASPYPRCSSGSAGHSCARGSHTAVPLVLQQPASGSWSRPSAPGRGPSAWRGPTCAPAKRAARP
jgi:hypothetical protein